MTTAADIITRLIKTGINGIRTLDIGTISRVISHDRADVKIKHLTAGQVREYLDVPVLPHGTGTGRLIAWPREGDTVILAFLQHEPGPQLEQRAAITEINEDLSYTRPVILTTIDTADSPAPLSPAAGELILTHQSGSYLRFHPDGKLTICAPEVNIIAPEDTP